MKAILLIVFLILIMGVGMFTQINAQQINLENKFKITLYPILDIMGRPLTAPVGSSEAILQIKEANKMYRELN